MHLRELSVLQQEDCGHILSLVPTAEPTLLLTFSLVDIWSTCGTQDLKCEQADHSYTFKLCMGCKNMEKRL